MSFSHRLGAVVLSCLACASEADESRVALLPYATYCFGFDSVHPCQLSEDSRTYDSIDGFEFEWGYRTVATIETLQIENPPADGSSVEYRLVDIESRTPVQPGARFELQLNAALRSEDFEDLVSGDCTRGFELFPGFREVKPFSVEGGATCESFAQRIANEVPRKLSFEFGAPDAPLKLVAFE